ncbi:LysR family transcriptional regulator [Psychrobacter sp. YP14]|uniref:LysR family transcriptional regulator n=2 Tax=Psychrobacter TaxID=497 RepID=A0A844M1A9_9GAMM|nr:MULTISPECIES: LysR family transcriptional regulator [Psychrobacter]AWT49092.1 LysR family transcriptional regulator [Psychrobacter sp. YP14]MUG32460.1 LysR family transcriptional regulator [Psychrobacter sanguinis]
MQLKRLTAFHSVARLKSFSEAVSQTQLSQPTLSRLIKQLEDDLGVILIDRYHRPLQLTEAGRFFYEKIDIILKELDSTISLTQKIAHPPDTLNIGFVPSVLYGLLPTVISRLKQRLPNLEVHLKDISSFKQIGALKAGEIDVGFGRFAHNDEHIYQLLLRHERYVAALPNTHELAGSHDIHLSQLQNSRVILYHQTHLPVPQLASASTTEAQNTDPSLISEPLLHLFAKRSALPHHTTSVSDIQLALGLVAAGEGITLVPDSLKSVRSEQISYRTLIHEDATSPIYICSLTTPTHPAFTTLLEVIYAIYEERGITYRRVI